MSGITVSGVFLCTFSSVYPMIDNYSVFAFNANAKKKTKKKQTKNKKKNKQKKNNRMPSAKLFTLDASAKSKYFYKLDIKDLNDNKSLL